MSSQDRRVMTISNQNYWPLVNYRDAQGRGFPCACRTHYLRQAKNNGSKQQMKPNREHKNTSRQKIQKSHTHKIHSRHELKSKSNSIFFSGILQDSENARLYDYSTGWVYSHGAGLSTLDVRQTLGSLFQSVTQFWFRSVSSIYVYEKKAQSESQTCHLNYGTPFTEIDLDLLSY